MDTPIVFVEQPAPPPHDWDQPPIPPPPVHPPFEWPVLPDPPVPQGPVLIKDTEQQS